MPSSLAFEDRETGAEYLVGATDVGSLHRTVDNLIALNDLLQV
jgi:hypothetical protein